MDNMDANEIAMVEEGFQVAQGRKRRRVMSSSSSSEVSVAAKPMFCIIGVPVNINDETIRIGTGCESANRVIKNIGRSKVASSVVILSF